MMKIRLRKMEPNTWWSSYSLLEFPQKYRVLTALGALLTGFFITLQTAPYLIAESHLRPWSVTLGGILLYSVIWAFYFVLCGFLLFIFIGGLQIKALKLVDSQLKLRDTENAQLRAELELLKAQVGKADPSQE